MKVAVSRNAVRQLLRWAKFTLMAASAGFFGYTAFVMAETWMLQRHAVQSFQLVRPASTLASASVPIAIGGLVGRMAIPRLGLAVAVAEGSGESVLRRAAGHIEGTNFPGMPGNVGIAGHRDTLFRPLRNIRKNDVIVLTTLQGEFHYRVVSTKIVTPDDIDVLDSDEHEILTLVTCHPFYFIGPAPNRFIVRAERIM